MCYLVLRAKNDHLSLSLSLSFIISQLTLLFNHATIPQIEGEIDDDISIGFIEFILF